jgi:hypothetical protein
MSSRSFDSEYIARFIQRFGYGAARGSSTRGARAALIQMIRAVKAGRSAGFSVDGPRGPALCGQARPVSSPRGPERRSSLLGLARTMLAPPQLGSNRDPQTIHPRHRRHRSTPFTSNPAQDPAELERLQLALEEVRDRGDAL